VPLNLTRSLLVVLVPGGIALFPWLLLIIFLNPEVGKFYREYPQLAWGMLFAAVVVVGSFFEGVNSYIENKWDEDEDRESDFPVQKDWFDYLARICPVEPIGHSYISRMATTMYFEMAMMWAAFFFVLGVALLWQRAGLEAVMANPTFSWRASEWDWSRLDWTVGARGFVFGFLGISASHIFRKFARDSHYALCLTRHELSKRLQHLDRKPDRKRFGPPAR
jgi:hypothetical protein